MKTQERAVRLTSGQITQLRKGAVITLLKPVKSQPPTDKHSVTELMQWDSDVDACDPIGLKYAVEFDPKNPKGWDWWPKKPIRSPFGECGDSLWVQETHYIEPGAFDAVILNEEPKDEWIDYRADGEVGGDFCWIPSCRMPQWASRFKLYIAGLDVINLDGVWNWECSVLLMEAFK